VTFDTSLGTLHLHRPRPGAGSSSPRSGSSAT
jgi:hypothetical protein